jgi:hypothetical protein
VIVHRATLDIPRELVQFVAGLLLAERRRRGTPRGSRALICFWQAVVAGSTRRAASGLTGPTTGESAPAERDAR